MMLPKMLPPSSEVRAIVIGIEKYPALGSRFDVPGAAVGALALAEWLVNERGVEGKNIQVWLSPDSGKDKDLLHVDHRTLNSDTLPNFFDRPNGSFDSGSFLIVYFCGHGLAGGIHGEQHLVLPDATSEQLRCIDVANWRAHFQCSGWEHFEHQLWITDACRNQWGHSMVPMPQPWKLHQSRPVNRFAVFSCNLGQESAIDLKNGPRFTTDILTELRQQGSAQWPDFANALQSLVAKWNSGPMTGQSPVIAEDWNGSPLRGLGYATETLLQILSTIGWTDDRYKPYLEHAARPLDATLMPNWSLEETLDYLHGLQKINGVSPILEFAERVACATDSLAVREWLEPQLSEQARAELTKRIESESAPVRARLSLWYRADFNHDAPRMEAEVDVIDAAGGVTPWQRCNAKPITKGLAEVVAQWVREVEHYFAKKPVALEIDLYLPRDLLLSTPCDSGHVGNDGEQLRLGEDHSVLLHCTDRFKNTRYYSRLRQNAPEILGRLKPLQPALLHWVASAVDHEIIRTTFVTQAADAPSWLGFDLREEYEHVPLDTALAEGLPAVTWLRSTSNEGEKRSILDELPKLLAAPLEGLGIRVQSWRIYQRPEVHQKLSVLLDQPGQLPKLFKQFSQP